MIRWRGYLDLVLSRYVRKPVEKDVRYLLWMTLYQVGFMKKAYYHVVKEAVQYARNERGKFVAGFVNAVLRRYVNDRETCIPSPGEAVRQTFPKWLVDRWTMRFGTGETDGLLELLNREPEFTLRVNTHRMTVDEAIEALAGDGIEVRRGRLSPSALIVDRLIPVFANTLFRNGIVSVQGEASQLAGMAVAAAGGTTILDACTGSATKTKQVREISPQAHIISMDNNMKRLRLSSPGYNMICADALVPPFRAGSFDTVLVDAPCSSLGIVRKHPEIKWRRTEEDISRFAAMQLSLLRSLWDLVRPGGRVVYSVCSFEPEETTDVIRNLAKDKNFVLENPLPFLFNKDCFLSLPHETALDGFFIARIRKL
ncbi:MAG: Ribosomal RNA small subunit methyltransferase B [Syntrophorhabdus sp. PtaB.Bin184]|nr:MAG: Ribosomal RNA small subunit methyltransferase B [Syntrophorhabdus sp. PtaB.Bin184]